MQPRKTRLLILFLIFFSLVLLFLLLLHVFPPFQLPAPCSSPTSSSSPALHLSYSSPPPPPHHLCPSPCSDSPSNIPYSFSSPPHILFLLAFPFLLLPGAAASAAFVQDSKPLYKQTARLPVSAQLFCSKRKSLSTMLPWPI